MYVYYNPNPVAARVGDCAVRAISKALNIDWEKAYAMIAANGFLMGDVIASNNVWGSVLRENGFYKEALPHFCPDCYTIKDFARDNPIGTYVVGTGNHVVTIKNGDYYDTWDSGNEVPVFFWTR